MKYLTISAGLLLSACTYSAPTHVSPAYNVYNNYGDKIPGRYALWVDANRMRGDFDVSGYVCSAHTYPVDAEVAFRTSVAKTLNQLFEYVETSATSLDRTELATRGFDGVIRVEVDDLDVDLVVVQKFWSADMKAEAEISLVFAVDGLDGRLAGGAVEGDDHARNDSGVACDGGADAIGRAVEGAMKEATEMLGERLSNEPRLRTPPGS